MKDSNYIHLKKKKKKAGEGCFSKSLRFLWIKSNSINISDIIQYYIPLLTVADSDSQQIILETLNSHLKLKNSSELGLNVELL